MVSKHGSTMIVASITLLLVACTIGCSKKSSPTEPIQPPPLPNWTIMVYMAADNNLAVPGIHDIDELEAAGMDPNVQVVVQAEFNPTELALDGCNDPSCINRPNFNTFRYALTGQGVNTYGPNDTAIDIGNRDMTDPAQLKEFIQWSKQNYPAQRYCLVLWNHGGGYTGLLQDLTSAPNGHLMSIGDLPTALNGVGAIDVLDFDMCLMGAYESLTKINGYAKYTVFSEEVVPGEGNQYTLIVDALQSNTTIDGKVLAQIFADQFYASYQGNRAPTTISAFDLAGFISFESALNTLAITLRANIATLAPAISTAAGSCQSYKLPQLKDIVNLLDSLRVQVTDPILIAQIDAVKAQIGGSFRLRNYWRNGMSDSTTNMSRSNGLTVVLPSRGSNDQLADQGEQSLSAYQSLYSGSPWTLFLTDWLSGQSTVPFFDQGVDRFEAYLVWDTAAVSHAVDIDMWILEPSGDLYIPYIGSVTPNGTFTNDSYYDQTFFEGYLTNRFVQQGTYKIYANLYSDLQNFRPVYDLMYRFNQVDALSSLYDPNYPQLSKDTSWLDDLTPTDAELDSGRYTDLQPVAIVTLVPPVPTMIAQQGAIHHRKTVMVKAIGQKPTSKQLAKARLLVKERRFDKSATLGRVSLNILPKWPPFSNQKVLR
jgi:Clostripain family